MNTLLIILLIIICLVLSFFVLIQNPKGGGLSGTFGGFGGQVMGVKKSTDAVEKGTWGMIGLLVLVTLVSFIMADKQANNPNTIQDRKIGTVNTNNRAAQKPQTAPKTKTVPGQASPVKPSATPTEPAELPTE